MPRKLGSNRTTLTEVARVAGVSPATASMVLSGKGDGVRIAHATADRVRAAAVDLDYTPNLLVRSLQQGTSRTLAVFSAFRVVDDEDAYMDRLSRGLERAAGRRGYDLLLHCAYDQTAEESYRSINGGRADGLLLFAPHDDDPMLPLMRRSRLPSVLLNSRDPLGVLPSVKDDFEGGMREVGEALIELGHRRIACLHLGPDVSPDAAERIRELDKTLQRHGVFRSDELTIDFRGRSDFGLPELFALPEPPTAIFCCADRIGYDLLAPLSEMGFRVPEDVSIVGYDGIRWPSESLHRVASVAVDLKALTASAVDLLIDGPSLERNLTIPTVFQPGTTLGPASNLQRSN